MGIYFGFFCSQFLMKYVEMGYFSTFNVKEIELVRQF